MANTLSGPRSTAHQSYQTPPPGIVIIQVCWLVRTFAGWFICYSRDLLKSNVRILLWYRFRKCRTENLATFTAQPWFKIKSLQNVGV